MKLYFRRFRPPSHPGRWYVAHMEYYRGRTLVVLAPEGVYGPEYLLAQHLALDGPFVTEEDTGAWYRVEWIR